MLRIMAFAYLISLYLIGVPSAFALERVCSPDNVSSLGREEIQKLGIMPRVTYFATVLFDARKAIPKVPHIGVAIAVTDCPLYEGRKIGAVTLNRSEWTASCKRRGVTECVAIYITVSYLKSRDGLGLDWLGRQYMCIALSPPPQGDTVTAHENYRLDVLRCMRGVALAVNDQPHAKWLARLIPPLASPSTVAPRITVRRDKE